MKTIAGLAAARGFASGPAFIYRGASRLSVPEYEVEPGREEDELRRLRVAAAAVRRDLESLTAVLRERTNRSDVKIFECHQMLIEDPVLKEEVERHIRGERLNAEAAVHRTAENARARFARMNDAYFRERVRDIDDVERRFQEAFSGRSVEPRFEMHSPVIVVADDLTPSEALQLPKEYVLGVATNGGSTTSHVALLARALGIPAVAGLGDVTSRVRAGERMLLDGTNGAVTLNPDVATAAQFDELIRRQNELAHEASSGSPAGTLKDGGEILLCANIHPGVPIVGLKEKGARGVGLYRSEYLWLNAGVEPTEEVQRAAYREAVSLSGILSPQAEVVIRVLDIGGDKPVAGIPRQEANPFLGNRSIRYLLSHPDIFRTQLRAILRASAEGRAAILYPMISCVEEVREANAILAEVGRELDAAGVAHDRDIPVGAMIEVPAAALNADAIGAEVDFFSIGTNDLIQYTMAADRANDAVARLYQPTNPAVIRLVRMTVEAAKRCGIRVGVCGESAADPVIGVLWAALGADSLSMSATYIPAISKLLSLLTRADLDEYAALVRDLPASLTAQEMRNACEAWMKARVPDLEEMLI